ncbi:glucokinase [Oceanobacillus oncorhynchi subsp. incaldanensis]|uniref:Beta-glucoside kinase n=2 Tax=Oceanobacillus TaxID=182709 RepID=A0A0A1MCD8_9BACI|nr:ROK family protein [Oceanobacillus oncorhynchi]MDM8102251.1 ROK family protein [Oceanobacillus oncorhynchi]GIO17642.1 glucokinase [Oceanobacillus oncorhynchi subsp. incaldanensis]CEI83025.1 Beta-glucoside kinase [Oceanobacillus oncorhynchi]
MKQYLAFDIGGTEIKYGILNEQGDILEVELFSSKNTNGNFVLDKIVEIASSKYNEINGLAISAPGFIDAESGYIENGGAYRDFDHFNMKSYLDEKLSIPVTIENDVNCVAYAEKWLGNAREDTDFVCMTIGTGIGGALFLNNQLYRGVSHRAGEFGYMKTSPDKTPNLFSNSLNLKATMAVIRKQFSSVKEIPLSQVTGEAVFQAFDEGDADAIEIISTFYDHIANLIYHIFYIINPAKILIGGGISNRDSFISELKSQLKAYELNEDWLEINTCYFKNHSGMVGATYHHLLKTGNLLNG